MHETNQKAGLAGGRRRRFGRAVVLAAVLVGMARMLPGGMAAIDPDSRPAPAPSPRLSPRPSLAALRPVSDLVYRVPPEVRPSCRPVDSQGAPVETLECFKGLTRALYSRFADRQVLDQQFDWLVQGWALPQELGACRAGRPSLEIWRYTDTPRQVQGRMACTVLPDGAAITILTQPQTRMFLMVVSNPSLGLAEHQEVWTTLVPHPPPKP